jgi:protein PhnA
MARGSDYQLRKNRLSIFGKELVRRSHAKCELCGQEGLKLTVFEVPSDLDVVTADECLFLCDACCEQIEKPKKLEPSRWRCLNTAIWSEVPVVQVMSARMLKRLAPTESWASELLEEAYFEEEVTAWIAVAD